MNHLTLQTDPKSLTLSCTLLTFGSSASDWSYSLRAATKTTASTEAKQ